MTQRDHFVLFTDGSCSGNPGPGGWAYHLTEPWGEVTEASGGDVRTTNNCMELQAAIMGLRAIPPGSKVQLFADSQYVIKGMTAWMPGWMRKDWKNASGQPVANKDLWVALWKEQATREVTWHWVKGHGTNEINKRVDALAVAQTKRFKDNG